MILYHGGVATIVAPDLVHSRKAVDFGPGFYVTPICDQAKRWSEKRKRRFGSAVVSRYEFDEVAAANLKMLRFEALLGASRYDGEQESSPDEIRPCH